jgi:hypothetical protein
MKKVKLYVKDTRDAFAWDADKPEPKSCVNWFTTWGGKVEKKRVFEVENFFSVIEIYDFENRKDTSVLKIKLFLDATKFVKIDLRMPEFIKAIKKYDLIEKRMEGGFKFEQFGSQVRLVVKTT